MKHIDIDKRFTEIVAEYIAQGYSINTAAMGGSQGELAKVDLTDGAEIIRVYVESFHDYSEDMEGMEIVVGRSTDALKPHKCRGFETIWTGHLEVLSRERFYKLGENRDGAFYGTEAEAKTAKQKRFDRYVARHDGPGPVDITDEALEIAKAVISRKFGVKRPAASRIKVSRRRGKYTVAYGSKAYTLH